MNMNDIVRVKLKPEGLRILQENHNDLAAAIRKRGGKMDDWSGAKVDCDGYYKTQLWCLFKDFGKHIRLGGENPFEMEILPDTGAIPEESKWIGVGFVNSTGEVIWEPGKGPGDLIPGQLVYVSHSRSPQPHSGKP